MTHTSIAVSTKGIRVGTATAKRNNGARRAFAALPAIAALVLTACGPQHDDETFEANDPVQAGVFDEATADVTEDELETMDQDLGSRPVLRLPFRCGQIWIGQTRSAHSPEQAIDFNRSGDLGDAVVASADGRVTRSESEGNVSYGNWVEIEHANGYRTRYAHLSVRTVKVNDRVRMGEKIGEVGNTGGSTGAHLHYEQLLNSTPIRIRFGEREHRVQYFETRSFRSANGC